MIMRKLLWIYAVLLSFCPSLIRAQGLQYIDEGVMPGYLLYQSGNSAVLVDNCGREVHRWNQVNAEFHPKLLPNGNVVYIEGFTLKIIEKDWDNNIVTDLKPNLNNLDLDYEVIVKPNGNYLCLGRRSYPYYEFENIGYDVGIGGAGYPSQYDVVVEVDRNTGDIVWQWRIIDHVIQQRDSSLANYGILSENPQLLNMDAISTFDWKYEESFMINGMDYNAELDQIALSVRKISEVVIIDHSTTTEEASGSTGGNSGKGGDIIYRWGNPANYDRGSDEDQFLYYQHNPNWIEHGEHKGKLIMYNNRLSIDDYSNVPIIDPPQDENGNYVLEDNEAYGPAAPDFVIGGTAETNFYSGYTSGAKVLPNGNILVTVGGDDKVIEFTPDKLKVWEYDLTLLGRTFRSVKYPVDYPAFDGKDLSPGATLEFPPSEVPCMTSNTEDQDVQRLNAYYDPASQQIILGNVEDEVQLQIWDLSGRLLEKHNIQNDLDISHLRSGMYIVQLQSGGKMKTFRIVR